MRRFVWIGIAIVLIAGRAGAEPNSQDLLAIAYDRKARGDEQGALEALHAARDAGIAPQRIALELAYVHLAHGDIASARVELETATVGPDQALTLQARRQLDQLPKKWWADLYAESFGWTRIVAEKQTTDLVPMVRVRGLRRFTDTLDINLYVFAQATRDLASDGVGSALPQIYADNRALTGGGALLRIFERRIGLFAQAGPAFALIDDGKAAIELDVRGGAFVSHGSAGCMIQGGIIEHETWCAELYGEAVYTSRFDHDVQAFFRGRTDFTYLETGPVSWQMYMEVRAAADRNGDYYDNFVESGLGPRWRLRRPAPIDLLLGPYIGTYFDRENVDPAPTKKDYIDLRLLVTTYVEFD
jgi:hypothetical protein